MSFLFVLWFHDLFGQWFYKNKNFIAWEKVSNTYLNCSVANTDRPIISKTNCLEEKLNDATHPLENNKECRNAFRSVKGYLHYKMITSENVSHEAPIIL